MALLVIFISLFALAGCSSSDKDKSKDYKGTITLQKIELDNTATSQWVEIESNTSWVFEAIFDNPEDQGEPWCYIGTDETSFKGSGNVSDIKLRTDENNTSSERSVKLILKADDGTLLNQVTLTQAGDEAAKAFSVSLREATVEASDFSQFVIVTCNENWQLTAQYPTGTAAWITGFSPSSGNGSKSDVAVNFSANTTSQARTATIVLTSNGESVTTTLTQKAQSGATVPAPKITLERTTVSATETSQTVLLGYSNGWQFSVEYPAGTAAWCTIGSADASGSGNKSVTLSYTVNASTAERKATLKLKANDSSEEATAIITQQGKEEVVTPSGWLELPDMSNLSSTEKFVTHYTTINNKKVRNYSMLFDTKSNTKIAYWVAYPHHTSYIGSSGRTNAWAYDPQFTTSEQPKMSKGLGGGYDRGHQIPSGDRTANKETNKQTFYYTNMTAQLSGLNQKVWQGLESSYIRDKWLKGGAIAAPDTLYIVTGAILNKPGESKTVKTISDNSGVKIAVPNYYFKALLYRKGNTYRAIGFWFEHKDYGTNAAANMATVLRAQAVSVRTLEQYTGFDFFPNLKSMTSDWDNVEKTLTLNAWGL